MDRRLKISGRDILGYLFLGLSVIMLGRSLMLCFCNDIWYDELFTVGMIEHSYGELIAFTARDVHPPLYYCIVKFVVELCKLTEVQASAVAIAKTVSVLPYFILLIYCVTFIRRRFGIFVGGLFLFCAVAMPQLSSYTVEVRMYSWALLFVTAAFLHAYGVVSRPCKDKDFAGRSRQEAGAMTLERASRRKKSDVGGLSHVVDEENRRSNAADDENRRAGNGNICRLHAVALVLYGLAAAYTQYFACVAVIMVYLYVLVVFLMRDRGRIKEWLLWVAVSVAGYVPWLYALFAQITAVNENYWILPLSWRSLGGCVKFLMKPAFTNSVLSTVLAVVMFAVYTVVFICSVFGDCGVYGGYRNFFREIRRKLCHNRRENDEKADNMYIEKSGKSADEVLISENKALHTGYMIAGIGVLAGLVLFGFVASALLRPIFVYRYMIPAMGCFWLSFTIGLDRLAAGVLEYRHRRNAVGALEYEQRQNAKTELRGSAVLLSRTMLFAVVLLVLIIGLRDYRAFMGEEEYKVLHMKQTDAALSSIAPEDIVIYNFDQVQAVTSYYLDDATDSYLWCGTAESLIQDIIRPYGTVEQVSQIKNWCEEGRQVWFIGSFNSREDIVAEWKAAGLQVEETGSYLLERYWFNLYKIF